MLIKEILNEKESKEILNTLTQKEITSSLTGTNTLYETEAEDDFEFEV